LKETQKLIKQIEIERDRIKDLAEIIQQEKESNQRSEEEISVLDHLFVNETEKLMPNILNALERVESLQRGDIYDLKGLDDPSDPVLFCLEATILILKYERKKTETIWDASKRMISEKAFINNINKASKPDYSLNPIVVHSIGRLVKRDEFEIEDLQPIAASVLRDWVLAIYKYHSTNLALIPKRVLRGEIEAKVQQRTSSINQNTEYQREHEQRISEIQSKFNTFVRNNELLVLKMKEMELQIAMTQGVVSSLQAIKNAINTRKCELEQIRDHQFSHCLLAAAATTYLGLAGEEQKREVLENWKHYIADLGLPSTRNFDIVAILDFYRKPDTFVTDLNMYTSILQARVLEKIVLFIDPFNVMSNYLPYIERDCKFAEIQFRSMDFAENLKNNIDRGIGLIITISESEDVLKLAENLKQMKIIGERSVVKLKTPIYVKVDKFLEFSENKTWFHVFTPILVDFSKAALQIELADLVSRLYNVDLNSRYKVKFNELSTLFVKHSMLVDKIIDYFAETDHSKRIDQEICHRLLDLEDQYYAGETKYLQCENSFKKIKQQYSIFADIGATLANVFFVVKNMRDISTLYQFSVDALKSICIEKGSTIGTTGAGFSAKRYCEEVIRSLFANVVPGMMAADKVIFSCMYAKEVASQKLLEKDPNLIFDDNLFSFFVHYRFPIARKWDSQELKNPGRPWLTDQKWSLIQDVGSHPGFESFVVEFSKYANRATTPVTETCWQEVSESRDPTKKDFPSKWNYFLNIAQKSCIIRCLRPESLGLLCNNYARAVLGATLVESGYSASPLQHRYRISEENEPIAVFCEIETTPIESIALLAAKMKINEPLVIKLDSLDSLSEPNSESETWVIIDLRQYQVDDVKREALLKFIDTRVFRVWLIFCKDDIAESKIHDRCAKVFLETIVEFKNIFYESLICLKKLGTVVRYGQNPEACKYAFNLCIAYSVLRYRTQTSPLVIDNYYSMQLPDLEYGLDRLVAYYEFSKEKSNIQSWATDAVLTKLFDQIWGCKFVQKSDYQWGLAVFLHFVKIEWDSEKSSDNIRLPFKYIYECYCNEDMDNAFEKVNSLPRGIDMQLVSLGYSESVFKVTESKLTEKMLNSMLKLNKNWQESSDVPLHEHILTLVEFREKLSKEMSHAWFKNIEQKSVKGHGARTDRGGTRNYFEILAKSNFHRYKIATSYLFESISIVIEKYESKALSQSILQLLSEISLDKVPSEWKKSGYLYTSSLNFGEWRIDFISRLKYIRVWYNSRIDVKTAEPLIFYDISKLFSPEEFFPGKSPLTVALKLEYSYLLNDNLDNLEFETIFIAEKQKIAPEKGCYVTGLYLYGGSVDMNKKLLRPAKPIEAAVKFPSVSPFNSRFGYCPN
jgi:hypothetical protein